MYCTRLGQVLPLLCVVKCAECCLPATLQGVYAKAAVRCIQKPHVLLEVWGGGCFGAMLQNLSANSFYFLSKRHGNLAEYRHTRSGGLECIKKLVFVLQIFVYQLIAQTAQCEPLVCVGE